MLLACISHTLPRLHALCLLDAAHKTSKGPPKAACERLRRLQTIKDLPALSQARQGRVRLGRCVQEGVLFIGQLPSLCLEADQAFNLTSFALSLLLVFRTNTSYSRWLDARKVWGGILNRSRDLVRQVRACGMLRFRVRFGGWTRARCGAASSTARATWSGRCGPAACLG